MKYVKQWWSIIRVAIAAILNLILIGGWILIIMIGFATFGLGWKLRDPWYKVHVTVNEFVLPDNH